MDIKTLEELQAIDERALAFTPLGLGRMEPEDAADFQQQVIARLDLADDVADRTRQKFEQLRTAYSHGVLCYELYTMVADHAGLTLEQALRDRFAAYYGNTTVEVRERGRSGRPGRVHQITVKGSGDFFERFHNAKAAELRADSSQPWAEFNGMLNGLLAWARREGLIRGQHNRSLEPVQRALRNIVAHGEYHLGTPVDAARELSDLAEFINHLWGQSTPGGRLYPAALRREIVAIGWSTDGDRTTAGYADQLADARDEEEFTYILVKAVFCPGGLTDPHLLDFDARCATTAFPTTFLWGPGPREEAIAWLNQNQPEPDLCDYLDQVLLVRAHDDRVDPAVYPGVAAGLPAAEQRGVWYAVRVDRGLDALAHVRALADAAAGHASAGECRQCPAETLAVGDITAVLEAARSVGADTTPLAVPDVRTPFADRLRPSAI